MSDKWANLLLVYIRAQASPRILHDACPTKFIHQKKAARRESIIFQVASGGSLVRREVW